VVVRGVGVNPTRTGVLDALAAMGADIALENRRDVGGEPVADLRARARRLHGTRIDGALAVRAIDELPLLAALAACAEGETVIADAEELRVKESDRIAAMVAALHALGASVEERPDGMIVRGGALRGGRVESRGDHRIAMASAVCALVADGETEIADTDNVATSFPGFRPTLARLGAPIAE
jgi:3-phosphoshikimate 1-carboxyvinyltransferase